MKAIEQENIEIYYFNWKNKKDQNAITAVNELKKFYESNSHHRLIILLDARGVRAEPLAVKMLSDLSRKKKAFAIAIVGLNEIQKIIAKKIRPDIYISDSIIQAKNWLIAQGQSIVIAS